MASSVYVIIEHYINGDGYSAERLHSENAYLTKDAAVERINHLIAGKIYDGYTLGKYGPERELYNRHQIADSDDVWANFNVGYIWRHYLSLRKLPLSLLIY